MLSMQSVRRVSAATMVVAAVAAPTPARADITEYPLNPSATPLARAMANDPALVRRAVFSALPPSSKPAAVSTTRLAGFPRTRRQLRDPEHRQRASGRRPQRRAGLGLRVAGSIDSRCARRRDHAHRSARPREGQLPVVQLPLPLGGVPGVRRRRLQRLVHRRARPLDLDGRDDRGPGRSTRPRTSRVDRKGNPIRINRAGVETMRRAYAKGTTFDGATRLLRASTPVTPGPASPVPVDLRPGRSHLRLGGLPRQPARQPAHALHLRARARTQLSNLGSTANQAGRRNASRPALRVS